MIFIPNESRMGYSFFMYKTGIFFIYDGDCPLCAFSAQAIRIQKIYGPLHLINARQDTNHPLIKAIAAHNLNLDEGMVIYANTHFYQGKEALKFMARFGDTSTGLMLICKSVFWSDAMAAVIYPWLRAARNWLLRRRNIPPLTDHLQKSSSHAENP